MQAVSKSTRNNMHRENKEQTATENLQSWTKGQKRKQQWRTGGNVAKCLIGTETQLRNK